MEPVRILAILILLGLVIFVHELGHFLLARWAGVLVERFSIGFGPVLLSFKRGDTEYALSAIPLGGYVKMLGQADTPGADEPIDDERSYQNKSVGARMAIISAGVIMNLIFGFVCFGLAYHLGVPYEPAIIGTAMPGRPAWEAGVRAGDNVVAINGQHPTDYEMLLSEVALTTPPTESVELDIERDGKPLHFSLIPDQEDMKPIIGVTPSLGLTLVKGHPTRAFSQAALAQAPSFEGEDKVVAIDGEAVETYRQFVLRMYAKQAEPVTITVERDADKENPGTRIDIAVQPNYVRQLGLQMHIGEVVKEGVQAGSPAAKAVDAEGKPSPVMPKDIIKAVDGVEGIDPMRLADVITAKAGQPVELTLIRPGNEQTQVKVTVVPLNIPPWTDFVEASTFDGEQPMSIPSIGLAYKVLPTISSVAEESPAALADTPLKPKDAIKKVEFIYEVEGKTKTEAVDVKDENWPSVFWAMQFPEVRKIRLTVERAGTAEPFTVELEPAPNKEWPLAMRGLFFDLEQKTRKEDTIAGAIHAGFQKTKLTVSRLYLFLRGLVLTRTLSPKNLAGPITIGRVAYQLTSDLSYLPLLILFLGSLSINLAIINFLPIPVLDGGHMVFLTFELLMRRQPSERTVSIATWTGIILIVSLMLYVFGLDFLRLGDRL